MGERTYLGHDVGPVEASSFAEMRLGSSFCPSLS
jgi:hypothetical protein